MHVYIVVAIGLAALLHAPTSAAHTCATTRAAVGTRLEIVNAENHAHSWCVVVPGQTPLGSIIAVDAIAREELVMGERAFVRINREMPSAQVCASRAPTPVACQAPPPLPCVSPLPVPEGSPCR